MSNLSKISRADKERLASALIELARRKHGINGQFDLLTWTAVYRTSLVPKRLFDIPKHRYLKAIYRDSAKEKVVYKASQMGASEYAVSYALHACDVRDATVLYVFPTETHVRDFSTGRIGPAIEASPYLQDIVLERRSRKRADRVSMKRVRNRFLYLRGAQIKPDGQAPQLKSIDADIMVLDEVDEMDARAPVIASKRLGHSLIGETLWVSTPTYAGFGIHAKWLESDQKEWFITCQACGQRQALNIRQIVTEWDDLERPTAWHGMEEGQAYAACEKCGKELDRLSKGEWVATCPDRDISGYHLTGLFGSRRDLLNIVKALQTTDETKRREAYNQDLGEPYTPRGGQMSDGVLDNCRRDYAHGAVRTEETFMGVDVGKSLHVVIRGPQDPQTGERPQRYAGEVATFERLGQLIRQYRVKRAVIDALPETRKARELQADFSKGVIWLAYYVSQRVGTKDPEAAQWNKDKGVVNLDRTRTIDQTFARFYEEENSLPGYAKDIPNFYAQMKAPVRVLEENLGGLLVARYVEAEADHFAHAENYCMVASLDPMHLKPARAY